MKLEDFMNFIKEKFFQNLESHKIVTLKLDYYKGVEIRFLSLNTTFHAKKNDEKKFKGILEFFKMMQKFQNLEKNDKFDSKLMKKCESSFTENRRFLHFFFDMFLEDIDIDGLIGLRDFINDAKKIKKKVVIEKKKFKKIPPNSEKKIQNNSTVQKKIQNSEEKIQKLKIPKNAPQQIHKVDLDKCKFLKKKFEKMIELNIPLSPLDIQNNNLNPNEELYLLNYIKSKIFEIQSKKLKSVQNSLSLSLTKCKFGEIGSLVKKRDKILEEEIKKLNNFVAFLQDKDQNNISRIGKRSFSLPSNKKFVKSGRKNNEKLNKKNLKKFNSLRKSEDDKEFFDKKKLGLKSLNSKKIFSLKPKRKKRERRFFLTEDYSVLPNLENRIFGRENNSRKKSELFRVEKNKVKRFSSLRKDPGML